MMLRFVWINCFGFAMGRINIFPSLWKSCTNNGVFVSLYNVDFQTCALECFGRSKCQGANFYTSAHACRMVNLTFEHKMLATQARGPCVFIGIEHMKEKYKESGLCRECDYRGTCVAKTGKCSDAEICPPGWIKKGSSCLISTGTIDDYNAAEQKCKSLHESAHLAYITTQDEQKNLENITWSARRLWIGGQLNDDGEWRWSDGSLVPDWGWNPGEPDNNRENRCMLIRIRSIVYWRNRKCYIQESEIAFGGLCEIDLPQNA